MRLSTGRLLASVLFALAALVVAGCGGGEGETAAPPDSGGGEPVATIDVVETDFEIDPQHGEVAQSGVIEVNLSNEGETAHSLEIEGQGEEFVSDTIDAGESTTFTADLPPGEYTWYCPIANHRDLGMDGSLSVGESGAGGAADDAEDDDDGSSDDAEDADGDSPDDSPGSGGLGY